VAQLGGLPAEARLKTADIDCQSKRRAAVEPDCRCLRLWNTRAATILDNEIGHDAQTAQHNLSRFLNAIDHQKAQVGELAEGIDHHFLKVTLVTGQGYLLLSSPGLKLSNHNTAMSWSVLAPSFRCYRSHPLLPQHP